MRRSEASIDRAIVAYAKQRGCLVTKLGGFRSGNNGWPDRLFVGPQGQIFFIEMKAEDGRLSVLQQIMVAELRARGVPCHVVYSVSEGKQVIDDALRSA